MIRRYKFALLESDGTEIVAKVIRAHSWRNAMKRKVTFPPSPRFAIATHLKLPNGRRVRL